MTNFFAEPVTVTIRDKDIQVTPLAVKNISKAIPFVSTIVTAFSDGQVNPVKVLEKADDVIALCAIATGLKVEEIGEYNPAELVALITAVISVNMDFFSQVVTPQVNNLMSTINTAMDKTKKVGTQALPETQVG